MFPFFPQISGRIPGHGGHPQLHEACIQRERNKGLFTADQQIEENGALPALFLEHFEMVLSLENMRNSVNICRCFVLFVFAVDVVIRTGVWQGFGGDSHIRSH